MNRKNKRVTQFVTITGIVFLFYLLYNDCNQTKYENDLHLYVGRKILNDRRNCSPRAINNFPSDVFDQHERKSGALVLHFLVSIYMFIGLAVVCEDYFVPCLECICESLKLQPDVAGATFMAAGSSAPELATTLIGVFIAKDDIALGAVVGSADYNLMLVIGLSALFAKTNIRLNWWPLFRDCAFYSISIVLLAIVIYDGSVEWYEAVIFLVFYGLYILLNYFNTSLELWAKMQVAKYFPNCSLNTVGYTDEAFLVANESAEEAHDTGHVMEMKVSQNETDVNEGNCCEGDIGFVRNDTTGNCLTFCLKALEMPDKKTAKCWNYVYYILCWPLRLLLCLTVPDCRIRYFRRWFWLTFFMSCVWISFYSYIMIWMITIVGFTLGIPDSVMGLTFIAAGSSIPDAISSVLVVREGQGDMAVSNAVGSNVFDILICMGFPWLLRCLIYSEPIVVYSKGLLYATMTLFLTVFGLVFITHLYNWRMSRSYGWILILIYVIFLFVCSMYELNIFGNFHPPEC